MRNDLIKRVRAELLAGTYDTDAKTAVAVDRLFDHAESIEHEDPERWDGLS